MFDQMFTLFSSIHYNDLFILLPVVHIDLQPAVVYWFVYAFKIVHLIMLTHCLLPLNVAVLRIYEGLSKSSYANVHSAI